MSYIAKRLYVFHLVIALFLFLLPSLCCRHLPDALDFLRVISAWDDEEQRKPPPNTRTHNHTHIENTMDNLMTWWDFRAKWKVWMTMGGDAAQPVLDWHPVAISAHSVGGNKAQCHGNHIKSTLKLIYLQKQWNFCDIHVSFALCVCFYNPMSISLRI